MAGSMLLCRISEALLLSQAVLLLPLLLFVSLFSLLLLPMCSYHLSFLSLTVSLCLVRGPVNAICR